MIPCWVRLAGLLQQSARAQRLSSEFTKRLLLVARLDNIDDDSNYHVHKTRLNCDEVWNCLRKRLDLSQTASEQANNNQYDWRLDSQRSVDAVMTRGRERMGIKKRKDEI